MESICLYHHYCSLDELVSCLQRFEHVEDPNRYVKSTLYSLLYLTAPNTSVIFKRTVSPRDIFQHRRFHFISLFIFHSYSIIYQFAYDLSVLPFINNKGLF